MPWLARTPRVPSVTFAPRIPSVRLTPRFPEFATEWSDGRVIDLGGLPGSTLSDALGINDTGHVVGYSEFPIISPPPITVPESSTWAMMLFGFAGLALAGYRRAKAGHATLAR